MYINWNSIIALNKLKLSNGSTKITKILHESIYVLYYLYKNCWSQIPIRPSLWLQILPNPSQRYDSSSEILWFINIDIVRDRLCETFSIFYHGLHVRYHEILTNLMIFRLCFTIGEPKFPNGVRTVREM